MNGRRRRQLKQVEHQDSWHGVPVRSVILSSDLRISRCIGVARLAVLARHGDGSLTIYN